VFVTYVAVLVVLMCGGGILLVALAVVPSPELLRSGEDLNRRVIETAHTPGALVGGVVLSATVLTLAALGAAALGREDLASRLRLHRPAIRAATGVAMVAGVLALGSILDAIVALLGWGSEGALGMMARALAGLRGARLLVAVIAIGGLAGLAEELFFRGYIQVRLRARFGGRWGVVITALLFGLLHFDPLHSALAGLLGLYLGWIAELADSIWPAVAAHVANNVLAVLLMALLPAPWPTSVQVGLLAGGLASFVVLAAVLHASRPRVLPVFSASA
jgi:uncharacterized protein